MLNAFAATYSDQNIADFGKSSTPDGASAPSYVEEFKTYGIRLAKFLKNGALFRWNLRVGLTYGEGRD